MKKKSNIHHVLAIETSCDETSVAWVSLLRGRIHLREQLVASQIPIHQKTRGVVPEVAAREHVAVLPTLVERVVGHARPDAIAVTVGPGLMPALMVGVETAKALAWAWGLPLLPVNHMEAHLLSNWIDAKPPKLPALCLIVSGGHTELILLQAFGKMQKLGQTRDDAAGEAFDKVAAMLELPYPGGPSVSRMAEHGNVGAIQFTSPMLKKDNFDFSFSGLKTEVLYYVQKHKVKAGSQACRDVCSAFQAAAVAVLVDKTIRAAKKFQVPSLLLAGGVAANRRLREHLAARAKEELPETTLFLPDLRYCTDNAAMIGAAALLTVTPAKSIFEVAANPNWEL